MRAFVIVVCVVALAVMAPSLFAAEGRKHNLHKTFGFGLIKVDGKGTEWWTARARRNGRLMRRYREQRDDLQRRLTRRVLEVRSLWRTLLHKPSSLEALRLASIAYEVPFRWLYVMAQCESPGLDPTLVNPTPVWNGEHATGLLQFLPSTFASTPYAGEAIKSPYANALAAGWMIGVAGRLREWACRPDGSVVG